MKHYKLISITDWASSDGKEHKKIVWFSYGGQKRGAIDFKFFETELQAQQFANTLI